MCFPSSSMKLLLLVGLCEQQSLDPRVQGLLQARSHKLELRTPRKPSGSKSFLYIPKSSSKSSGEPPSTPDP